MRTDHGTRPEHRARRARAVLGSGWCLRGKIFCASGASNVRVETTRRSDAVACAHGRGSRTGHIPVLGEYAQRLFSSMPAWPKVTSRRPAGSGKACKSTSHAAAETSEPVARMGELASEHWRAASAMSLVSRIFSGIGWPSRLDGRLSLQLDARRSSAHRPSGLRPYHWSKRPAR